MVDRLRSVVLAGGGTAGHVNPLLAVADELAERFPQARLTALGTAEGLEHELVPARGYPLRIVPRVPLPRRPSPDLLRLPSRLAAAVRAAGRTIEETEAQVVIGFGGYVATPAYLAARRRRVPVVVHEANARPGLANRLGARFTEHVAVTFPGTKLPGAVVTGMPLRAEITELARSDEQVRASARLHAAAALGLAEHRVTLLVTGGSLGAQRINDALSGAAADLLATGAQVLHLTGAGKAEPVRAALADLPADLAAHYHVREYLDEMHHAFAIADLVVCRAGAVTVSEIAALGLPAVYVPLPIGNGEQRLNATAVTSAGGGVLVRDEDLTAPAVRDRVVPLLRDPDRLRAMAAAARRVGVRDGAARIADLVVAAAGVERDGGGAG